MSDLSFEQLLDEYDTKVRTGEVVTGKVIDVKPDQIVLNIGYKADGVISRGEYTTEAGADLTTKVKVGDELTCKVIKLNDGEGQVQLSYRRLAAERGSERLQAAFDNHEVLTAKVNQVLSGGLSVTVDETRVFIPASLVSDVFEKDLSKYQDQEVQFVITEFNPKKRRVIGNCKELIVANKEKAREELFSTIKEGLVVEGKVKNVTDFGAFVDLGGADGLIHISEMGWSRLENPKKVFKVGQVVTAFIKDIKGTKIALSMKFPDQSPWAKADEKYAVNTVVTGKVVRMTEYGAFVELEDGIDALLHVSQISKERVGKPADVLSIGQEITAMVIDFNKEEHKISLSMKALLEDDADETVASTDEATEE
ncbi:MAG: 30S ribosomal protein S1 [Lachnospiraceae bacterium]|nr:30S ribosomal protein S1 [Lachnospiraceae bacterium]